MLNLQNRNEFYYYFLPTQTRIEPDIQYGYEWQLNINLIACTESYDRVNHKTGEIEKHHSEHTWISSIPAKIENLHELFNLGMRKMWLAEDSFNTEKNRGYNYKHAFSYQWNAMQGFHLLMRLGHAINALSEFAKTLKKGSLWIPGSYATNS